MKVKVLFVCLGNICRSPTAHGVFQTLVNDAGLSDRIEVDSAGTAAWHIGKSPDSRSSEHALQRGYDLSSLRARQALAEDFSEFNYILAMDEDNLRNLQALAPGAFTVTLDLFLNFSTDFDEREVPDPYYGGAAGFERVLDLIESASTGLLQHIQREHF